MLIFYDNIIFKNNFLPRRVHEMSDNSDPEDEETQEVLTLKEITDLTAEHIQVLAI